MSKLKAYKISPTIIDLEWKQLVEESAVGYELEFAISPGRGWQPVMPAHEGTESLYSHEDLVPDTRYYYRVRGLFADGGKGEWSEIATASTGRSWLRRYLWLVILLVVIFGLLALISILSLVPLI